MLKLHNPRQATPVAAEEVFRFDEDETRVMNSDSRNGNKINGHLPLNLTYPFDLSRLPNFENEEIISIRPKKNFSFDIMAENQFVTWEFQTCINKSKDHTTGTQTRSTCFDLSSMFSNVALDEEDDDDEEVYYDDDEEDMTTIEGLRLHLRSCFTCGVCWGDEHASLDCIECGGYALSRPCPECDGKCHGTWTRNLDQSHSLGKAKWTGTCFQNLTSA